MYISSNSSCPEFLGTAMDGPVIHHVSPHNFPTRNSLKCPKHENLPINGVTGYKSTKTNKSKRVWKFIKSCFLCMWVVKCISARPNQIKKNSYKKNKIPKKEQMNSESKIDNISRIMFPITFLLINVFYWYSYISHSEYFKQRIYPNQ